MLGHGATDDSNFTLTLNLTNNAYHMLETIADKIQDTINIV